MAEATKQHATGRIGVDSFEPKPYEESTDGPALLEVDVCEKFIRDIEGEGVVRFLQAQPRRGVCPVPYAGEPRDIGLRLLERTSA